MVLSDKKAIKRLHKEIADNGKIARVKALRLCQGVSQLDRILSKKCGIVESYGFITTKEEIEDMRHNKSKFLLVGNNTNGIGGSYAL